MKIFLSYALEEKKLAEKIRNILNSTFKGKLQFFLASQDIIGGDEWKSKIKKAISEYDALLMILTPTYSTRPWCFIEWASFWANSKTIYYLVTDDLKIPSLISPMQDIQATNMFNEEHVRSLFENFAKNAKIDFFDYDKVKEFCSSTKLVCDEIFGEKFNNAQPDVEKSDVSFSKKVTKKFDFDSEFDFGKADSINPEIIQIDEIPNSWDIQLNISSKPLIVLFGPANIGKTTTLVRLGLFLSTNHKRYKFEIDRTFRNDKGYEYVIENFSEFFKKKQTPSSTSINSTILCNINDSTTGETFCQILDSAGETFFDRDFKKRDFPNILKKLFLSPNKKIYLVLIDMELYKQKEIFNDYISNFLNMVNIGIINQKDKIIILFTKYDQVDVLDIKDLITSRLFKQLSKNPIIISLKKAVSKQGLNNIEFIPFVSGEFPDIDPYLFNLSNDYYPKLLWNSIEKFLSPKKLFNK